MILKRQFISALPKIYEAITSLTGVTPKGRAQGVDVYSKYQGYFRPETATQQIDFAIQKLTEGTTIVDLKRDEIWNGVKQIGMRGAYHYQRSGISWRAQADYFLDIASKYDHHFFALDVEKINNTLNDSFWADMYRIIHHWTEQAPSKKIVLYSNKDLFSAFIYPRIKALYGGVGLTWLIDNVNVWYAQYWLTPSVDKDPALPVWMKTWKLWQITPSYFTGASFGVQSKEVDVDVYNGTPDQMRAWLGVTSQPPVEPPPIVVDPPPVIIDPEPDPQLWHAEVIVNTKLHVRNYPAVMDATVTAFYVFRGHEFQGRLWSGNGYVWMQIDAPTYPELHTNWVAVRTLNGSSKFITLTKPNGNVPPATSVNIYRVRKWGDPIMVAEAGLDVNLVGTSNFQAVGLYNIETSWGGVTNFLRILHGEMMNVKAMQVEDEYLDKQPDWRAQKMNWLCKPRGTIYFEDVPGMGWESIAPVRWGTIALGNNLVAVEGIEDMLIGVKGDNAKRWRKMARLAGFRKTDWGRPLNDLLALGLVHRCYCAYKNNVIGDSPKGIVYSPFFSPLDWDFAGVAQPKAFYLPVDWLVSA